MLANAVALAPSREGEGGRRAFERRIDGGAQRNNLNGGFVAGAEIGAAGRALGYFLRVFERTQKFEFGQTKWGSGLNADFKEEYSKGLATQIARILHGSKCDVYVAFCL